MGRRTKGPADLPTDTPSYRVATEKGAKRCWRDRMHWVVRLSQVWWNLITFITNLATGISRFWLGRGGTHRAWAVMSSLRGHGAGAEIIGQVLQSFTSIWRCNCGKWCSNWWKKQTWDRWTKRLTNGQIDVYSHNHLTKNGWISNYKRKKSNGSQWNKR